MSIILPLTGTRCLDCERFLNQIEVKYYKYRCEWCEGKFAERVRNWKKGHPDQELDGLMKTVLLGGGDDNPFDGLDDEENTKDGLRHNSS